MPRRRRRRDRGDDWPVAEFRKARAREIKEHAIPGYHWSDADRQNAAQVQGSDLVASYVEAAHRARQVPAHRAESLQTQMAYKVTPRVQHWLWPGRIPQGALTLILGEQGVGKSLLMLDLAARVTSGQTFPDEPPWRLPAATASETSPGAAAEPTDAGALLETAAPLPEPPWPGSNPNVLRIPLPIRERMGLVALLAGEDDYFSTAMPYLDRMQVNPTNLILLHDIGDRHNAADHSNSRPIRLPHDLYRVEYVLQGRVSRQMLVIDSLTAFTDRDMNGARVRELYLSLAAMARRTNSAVVCLQPVPALISLGNLRRILRAPMAAARSIWCLARDPVESDRRLFIPLKMNLGPLPSPLAFRFGQGRLLWEPPVPSAGAAGKEMPVSVASRSTARAPARQWLRDQLAAGPLTVREVNRRAAERGISPTALRRAKEALGVRSWRTRVNDQQAFYLRLESPHDHD